MQVPPRSPPPTPTGRYITVDTLRHGIHTTVDIPLTSKSMDITIGRDGTVRTVGGSPARALARSHVGPALPSKHLMVRPPIVTNYPVPINCAKSGQQPAALFAASRQKLGAL